MKMELQEMSYEKRPEAKAFEAGWFKCWDYLIEHIPSDLKESNEWQDYTINYMFAEFDKYHNEQIQEQTSWQVSIELGRDGSRSAGI